MTDRKFTRERECPWADDQGVDRRGMMALIEELSPLDVLNTSGAEVTGGTKLLRKYSDQNLTLTDAIGLQVMRDRRVRSCWSTDRHLRLTGVPLVIDTV